MQIKNSVFLITGGASGLGAATARMAAESGGKVVLADLNADMGEKLAKELGGRFIRTDVTAEADGKSAVALAQKEFGGLHVLVNCAGIGTAERTVGKDGPHNLAHFTKVVTINLIGSFNMIRLAAAAMVNASPNAAGERGVVINTASVAAFDGQIGQAAYSASKGGIVGMTLPIARDLARNLVRVVTIAPGLFRTPLFELLPPDALTALGAQVPHPARLGEPPEFAALVAHVVANPMLNGETIRLDGAIRMAPK
jgi:NAD(P)-dependent dehydrogenase (short-subunit alcohol dehydrogenase family)